MERRPGSFASATDSAPVRVSFRLSAPYLSNLKRGTRIGYHLAAGRTRVLHRRTQMARARSRRPPSKRGSTGGSSNRPQPKPRRTARINPSRPPTSSSQSSRALGPCTGVPGARCENSVDGRIG